MIPVQDGQVFVDEDGGEVLPREIRFGMKDHDGRIHYFCMRALRVIPEYEAFEIYPKGWKKSDDPERTAYCFRAFGSRKTEEELITELLLKLNNALAIWQRILQIMLFRQAYHCPYSRTRALK